MLFYLIKKDILIIKKYIFLAFFLIILIPPFFIWWSPQVPIAAIFLICSIFAEFMLCEYLSMKESVYHKTSALLCALPYSRSSLVEADYIFFVLIFLYCYLIFIIEGLLMPQLKIPQSFEFGTLAFISIIYSIYMPIQYKLGYEKTKFFFFVIIMTSPFILPSVIKSQYAVNAASLFNLSNAVLSIIFIAASILTLSLSAIVSCSIYSKKELF